MRACACQLRRGATLFNPKQIGNLTMRKPLDIVKIENRAIPVGEMAHLLKNFHRGELVERSVRGFVRRLINQQILAYPLCLAMTQVFDTKIYRHTIHPPPQRTRTTPLKATHSLKDAHKAVVQQIFSRCPIAHVTLTQGHKMPSKAIVKLLLSLTVAFFQTNDQFKFLHGSGCDSHYKRIRDRNTALKRLKNYKKNVPLHAVFGLLSVYEAKDN